MGDEDAVKIKRRRRISDLIEWSGLQDNDVREEASVTPPTVSRSTISSTSTHVKRFREYLRSEQQPTNFEDQDNVWLNEWLGNFYAEVVSYNGKPYSQKTLACMRASLHRYLDALGRINKRDLRTLADFRDANLVLVGRRRELQRQENTNAKSHAPITESDMAILRAYFRGRTTNPLTFMEGAAFYLLYYFSSYGCDLLGKLRVDSLKFSVDQHGRCFVTLQPLPNSPYCYEDLTNKEDCPYTIIRDYIAALPSGVPRLFMHALDSFVYSEKFQKIIGFKADFGCSGRFLSELMSRLSAKLKLGRRYTNHCVRSTVLHITRSSAVCSTGEMIEMALRNYGRQPGPSNDVEAGSKQDAVVVTASSLADRSNDNACNIAPIDLSDSNRASIGDKGSSLLERPSVIFANLTLNLTFVKK